MRTAVQQYFAEQWALLDPHAWKLLSGTQWSLTVPSDRCYHVGNAWCVYLAGQVVPWFHRPLDVRRAASFGPGTTFAPYLGYGGVGVLWYADTKPIIDSAIYTDFQEAYYARLLTIPQLPLKLATLSIPAGTKPQLANGNPNPAWQIGVAFDWGGVLGVPPIMIRHLSLMEASWAAITGYDATNTSTAMNMLDEISDLHGWRKGEELLMPLYRNTFTTPGWTNLKLSAGNASGNRTDPTDGAVAVCVYSALPSNW
jgi:hypothetical protein